MVSLRERKSRPSYSLLAQGLEDLSDSDKSDGVGGKRPAGEVGDEQDSLSSGDSSEFELPVGSPKRKRKAVTGRKSAGDKEESGSEDDDDDDASLGEPTEDEDEKMDIEGDGESDDDLVSIDPSPGPSSTARIKSQFKPQTPRRPIIFPRPVSGDGVIAFVQSDFNLIPPAYRNLIKEQSASMAKGPPAPRNLEAEKGKDKDRTKTWGVEVFPSGPVTAYHTRLRREVRGRKGHLVDVHKEEKDPVVRREKRRREAFQIANHVSLVSPWQAYRGESWWPEMFRSDEHASTSSSSAGPSSKSKGKIKMMRSEVRMGLDHIGRFQLGSIDLLTEQEAEPFLPTLLDSHGNPHTTCHVGTQGCQTPVNFDMFSWRRIEDFTATKEGFVFSAGGPIWGLDWCPYPEQEAADFEYAQYLAVSPLPHVDTRPAMGEKWPKNTPGGIQIWSMLPAASVSGDEATQNEEEKGAMKCEMVLCVDGGPAMELKWMPLGGWDEYDILQLDRTSIPKLGIIAAAQLDGSISFYSVPHPKILRRLMGPEAESNQRPLFVRLRDPLLRLDIADASCTCLDWMTGTRLAVGLSNGHAAVWDVGEALRSGSQDCLPSVYMTIALSYIRSVAAGRCPPGDSSGRPQYDQDPTYLVLGSYDGTATLVDLRDPMNPMVLNRARTPTMAVAWSSQVVAPLLVDVDYAVQMVKLRGSGAGRNHVLASHLGPVWDISTSEYHPMVASAGSDGSLRLSTAQTGFYRRRKAPLLSQTLYEIEYDIHTGEYRMVENILPETKQLELISLRQATTSKKGQRLDENPQLLKTANWPVQVGIHRVAWNNGAIGSAEMLASGTASGLGRIDFVRGRFKGGVEPVIQE